MDKILEINPKDKAVYSIRANIYGLYNNPEKYYREYARAIRQIPDYAYGHYCVSNVYTNIFDYENALKHINMAIGLADEPRDYLFYKRGVIYKDMGNYEDAINDFTKAIELNPTEDYYYSLRSECYRKTNKIAEADKDEEMSERLNEKSHISLLDKINIKVFKIKDKLIYTKELF